MSISIPPTQSTSDDRSRRVRVQASDTHFFAAFATHYQAYTQIPQTPLTDDAIYRAFQHAYRDPALSPRGKAGAVAGWFAALYHIPCAFGDTPPAQPPLPHTPRPIDLHVTEPLFVACYSDGYQQAGAPYQAYPLTDDEIFVIIDGASLAYVYQRRSLTATRCCAGYLAGWFARFYGVRSLVDGSFVSVLPTAQNQQRRAQ